MLINDCTASILPLNWPVAGTRKCGDFGFKPILVLFLYIFLSVNKLLFLSFLHIMVWCSNESRTVPGSTGSWEKGLCSIIDCSSLGRGDSDLHAASCVAGNWLHTDKAFCGILSFKKRSSNRAGCIEMRVSSPQVTFYPWVTLGSGTGEWRHG